MPKKIVISSCPDLDKALSLEEIGKVIKHQRTVNGIRIEDLANWLSMSKTTVVNLEKGNGKVSTLNLFKALKQLGIRIKVQI